MSKVRQILAILLVVLFLATVTVSAVSATTQAEANKKVTCDQNTQMKTCSTDNTGSWSCQCTTVDNRISSG
jgi:hypothetical protein